MPVVANGSRTQLFYIQEDGSGDIPAVTPEFKPIRYNTDGMSRNVTQIDSAEINPSRQRPVSRQGTYSVAGEIVSEGSYGSFDDLLEAVMQGAWTADVLKVGVTVPTFAIVERHTDISEDYIYRHCRVATLNIAAPLDSAAQLTFGVIGEEAEAYKFPGDETFAAATTTEMMVTTQGGFDENSVAIDYLTDYNLTIDNNMAPLFSLFQRPAYSVQNGIFIANGTMTAYMPDGDLFAKFLGETATDHEVTLTENSQSYVIALPSVIYTQAEKAVAGDGPILP